MISQSIMISHIHSWLANFCVPWINFADFCLVCHDQLHGKKNDSQKWVKKYYLFCFSEWLICINVAIYAVMLYLSLAQIRQRLIFFPYNVVLVSAAQQNKSVISKYRWASLLSSPPISHLGLLSYSKTNSTRALHSNSYLLHTWYVLPALCPQVCFPWLHLFLHSKWFTQHLFSGFHLNALICTHIYLLLLYLVATNLNRSVWNSIPWPGIKPGTPA